MDGDILVILWVLGEDRWTKISSSPCICSLPSTQPWVPPKATTLVTHMTPLGQGAQKEKIKMKGSWRKARVHLHLGFERFVRTKEALSSLSKVCNASPAGFHLCLPD